MCNNPSCVNPFHLKVGTQKENMEDMVKAGRQNKLKGEKHNRAKLKNEQVLEIRALKKSGMRTCDIMKKFSLSKTTVLRIISRRLWKHI
jgi:DNA invertase Pin-like site-specific DNA recombinase